MSVAIEEGRVAAEATEGPAAHRVPTARSPSARVARRPARPCPEAWCSTLEPADLARLLSVIETRLIPRLVAEFTPAHCASLEADRRNR